MEITLTQAGFTVVGIAGTVKEAVAQAQEHRPSVVLMDIRLPADEGGEIDWQGGIKAAQQIRCKLRAEIVYLTGQDVSDDLLAAERGTRPSAFLTKPVTDKQLLASVRDAMAKTNLTKGPGAAMPGCHVEFNDQGWNKNVHPVILQWQSGKLRTVYPESDSKVKPVWPIPAWDKR